MPEGPEAHTIARKLSPLITGKDLIAVTVNEVTLQQGCEYLVLPLKVCAVYARGKRVLFVMERGVFVTFLGMTGRWCWNPGENSKPHLTLTFECGGAESGTNSELLMLHYLDPRRFGMVSYYFEEAPFREYFAGIGPDLLSETPTPEQYICTLRNVAQNQGKGRKRKIPTLTSWLLEQKYYSGVGNYLKSEILYRAGLNPQRTIDQLSDEEVLRMYTASVEIIQLSYQHGGLTLRDYWSPNGERGTYPCEIYGRNGQRDKHQFLIQSYKDENGRNTFWVPEIQR